MAGASLKIAGSAAAKLELAINSKLCLRQQVSIQALAITESN
jgi:hypothetical protein